MTEATARLKTFFQDTYSQAQSQVVNLAEYAQSKLKDSSTLGRERLDELTAQFPVTAWVKQLKSVDALSPGYIKDLSTQLGLSTQEDISALRLEIGTLKKEIANLKRRASLAKAPATANKKAAKKASTTKSGTAKKATRKKTAKASSNKKA